MEIITVNDKMQRNYTYRLTELPGLNFHPDFKPHLTPPEMLAMGIFGGRYLTDCTAEFPETWFAAARLCPLGPRAECNYFGVLASKPLSYWRAKGWLHPEDPRGWFQWYCRYYQGRRMEDDLRQIRRWQAIKRHVVQLQKACLPGDTTCRPRQRQALLHWAYDSRCL